MFINISTLHNREILLLNVLVVSKLEVSVMILQNNFVTLFLIICLQTATQDNLNQYINKRSTNQFQRYRGTMKVLNKYNNTIYFDNILHSIDFNNYSMEIEKAFRNTMAMHGVQYIYKRDFYWRTWRYATREKDVIFFKSQSINPINCIKCHAGFWIIEEKPPLCRYEILALKTDQDICVFTQRDMINDQCPKIISVRDLIHECGNPIRTKIRITYKYTDVSHRNTVICERRESCEITTLYSIYPDFIVFQIINSTNHVIYSRIMKDAYRNYVYTNNYVTLDSIKQNKKDEVNRFDKSKNENTECFNISNRHGNTEKLFFPSGLHYKVYSTKTGSRIIQIFHETSDKLSPCKKLELMQMINEENDI